MDRQTETKGDNSDLEQVLRINDGWGDLLDKGTIDGRDLNSFVDFLAVGLLPEEEAENLEFTDKEGVVLANLPENLPALEEQEIINAYAKFKFLQSFLNDSSKFDFWTRKILTVKEEGPSLERVFQLIKAKRQLEEGVSDEGLESPAISALFLERIVNSFDSKTGSLEKRFLDSLSKEFFQRDLLVLDSDGKGDEKELKIIPVKDILEAGQGKKEELKIDQWTCSGQKGKVLIYPFKEKSPQDNTNIGRCCFTLEPLSLGLLYERKRIGFKKSTGNTNLERVPLVRIVYNRYENPRLSGTVRYLIHEKAGRNDKTKLSLSEML